MNRSWLLNLELVSSLPIEGHIYHHQSYFGIKPPSFRIFIFYFLFLFLQVFYLKSIQNLAYIKTRSMISVIFQFIFEVIIKFQSKLFFFSFRAARVFLFMNNFLYILQFQLCSASPNIYTVTCMSTIYNKLNLDNLQNDI
jgi:hypothetical protein